jgi:hypothetical protein
MTLDELLARYGELMHEAGIVRGELAVMMRMSKEFHNLPDAPIIPSSLTISEPIKLKKVGRPTSQNGEIILKVVNSYDRAVSGSEIYEVVKKDHPNHKFTSQGVSATLGMLSRNGEIIRAHRGLYQRIEGKLIAIKG